MLALLPFAYQIISTSKIPSNFRKKTSFPIVHCPAQRRRCKSNMYNYFSTNSSPCRLLSLEAVSNDHSDGYFGFDDDEDQGLKPELVPKHVAVILDGNRRWAMNNNLPVEFGHRAGGENLKQLAISCSKLGVQLLTVFVFSTENWVRPHEEVESLMSLFEVATESYIDELIKHGMQISFIGDKTRLPQSLRSLISSVEVSTKANRGMRFVMAMNYSGRYDIIQASKKIATKIRDGILGVEDIDEATFEKHLMTGGVEFPHPDLLIRTSGEIRISNFMLWQLAYSELWFVNKLFPDFEEADLIEAFKAFQRRQRRYGGQKDINISCSQGRNQSQGCGLV